MRLLQRGVRSFNGMLCLSATALIISGCGTPPHETPPQPGPAGTPAIDRISTTPLQINDRIEIRLTGTPMEITPVDMDISDKGTISLAYIDQPIQAAGRSPQELEEIIRTNLVPKIYTHVNVTVIALQRYFYVNGQINPSGPGGRVPYMSRITVTGAIGAAGGFNEFAAKNRVQVTRLDGTILIVDCVKARKDPKLDIEVFPGDRIFVDRRTFREAVLGKGQ